ncbi:MAG: DUF2752 domain-containing protein [Phycisphaerales bacterium]|nr:DUF2752 domain-containing protein [Phycisphaerales bacterium]
MATAKATRGERAAGAAIAVGCLALLVVSAWLRPEGAGHGTHEQLGLPACGWAVATGYPCPTCGMTTAFAHAADLELGRAIVAQPFAAAAALATAAAFWAGLHVAVFGSRLGRIGGKLLSARVLWWIAGAWGASWAYKVIVWNGGG